MSLLFIAALTIFSLKYLTKPLFILLIVAAGMASWFTDRFGVVGDHRDDRPTEKRATYLTTASATGWFAKLMKPTGQYSGVERGNTLRLPARSSRMCRGS
ncbi:phosphoethanolamine transferase domain-containing protein [Pararhizobium sp. LjRoot255]|uniref:phosphoethanolamine transferase domain-containing protein n=1 Tax=Pararhizobium sp. LjRoot255 TaxID=3342298 RepID=UPI003F4FA80A